jgi:tetratricopeptide (TPR) repeat protein
MKTKIAVSLFFSLLTLSPGAVFAAPSEDASSSYLKGLVHERFGQPQDAVAFYEQALKLDPEARFLHETLAALCVRLKRMDRALEAARRVAALAPGDPDANVLLGRIHMVRQEPQAAMASFDQALAKNPSHAEALLYSAYIRSERDPRGAIGFYERYLNEFPQSPEAWTRIAELQESLLDFLGAEKSWTRASELDTDNAAPLMALGRLAERRGDRETALARYEAARFLEPTEVAVLVPLGETYTRLGRPEAARQVFEAVLRQNPSEASSHFGLALLAEAASDWDAAARHMAAVAPLSDEVGVPLRLAYYHLQAGRRSDALKTLHQAQKRFPDSHDLMAYLGLAYQDAGKTRKSLSWWLRAIEKAPDRAEYRFRAAVAWDTLKKFDKAEPLLGKAIELKPTHATALNYLGYSWADRGQRLPEALLLIERALKEDPDNGAFLDSHGWALFKLGRSAEAETSLARAVHLSEDSVVWGHYGDVLQSLGRRDEAVRAWEEGLLLDPSSGTLKKRLRGVPSEGRLRPMTAARAALKRVEANFIPLHGLASGVLVDVRKAMMQVSLDGIFYFEPPQQVRLEVVDALYVPQVLVIRNKEGLHVSLAEGSAVVVPPIAEEGVDLLASVLSGRFFKRFDDVGVKVKRRGSRLTYRDRDATLEIDGASKRLLSASGPGGALLFDDYEDIDGHWLPRSVRFEGPVPLTLRFRRWKVNPSLDPSLFRTPR